MTVDVSDTMHPEHMTQMIIWSRASLVSLLLINRIDEHTEYLLREQLSKDCNDTVGDVPPLTALAWQSRDPLHTKKVVRMAQMLIEKGAEPTYVSRDSCRSRYTIPDAISLATFAHCVPLLRTLLMYWWPSPVYLLDSVTGRRRYVHEKQTKHASLSYQGQVLLQLLGSTGGRDEVLLRYVLDFLGSGGAFEGVVRVLVVGAGRRHVGDHQLSCCCPPASPSGGVSAYSSGMAHVMLQSASQGVDAVT
ncbi:Hypothetical predicted protein [Cloeon dipterum]|uniref:Uncharacterized protein n=1 Tax=Cloeon dipterum TaxID=197152 RepID=A0A8S1CJP8_9INSE|nr:Hypothetical predicted protein [Cloeon dipterum]